METFKQCTKCEESLPATIEFYSKQKNGKYGLNSKCKKCISEYNKQLRSTPEAKERHRLYAIEWRKNNPDRNLEISRKSYQIHGQERSKKAREKYWNDSEQRNKQKEYDRKYKESGKRLIVNSKPENRERARKYSKIRRNTPDKREQDSLRMLQWRKENKEYLDMLHKNKRVEMKPSYIAQSLRIKTKDLTPEVLETKRLIISLKRELKSKNIKIS